MKKLVPLLITAIIFLSSCGFSYKVDVDLSNDEISATKTRISELKDEIKNFEGSEGQIAADQIVELARSYMELGELGKAIKVYEDVLAEGHKTLAILNNLGKLYDEVGEYDKAIAMYQRLVDEYFEAKYLRNITWSHIKAGNRKEAEKYFNAWQLEFQKTDEQIQKAIKELREEEKKG
ncbi:tetratricopeptide repeat protein [Candidatus Peregrinibacteria bacterium]|nr:tetratricopeptide repeat protein [Candidatus Peregrinibacteria bacterium]